MASVHLKTHMGANEKEVDETYSKAPPSVRAYSLGMFQFTIPFYRLMKNEGDWTPRKKSKASGYAFTFPASV